MAPTHKLLYFNLKALAEPLRFLMRYGGIEFEDERFEFDQWDEIKPKTPFGQLPILTVNGKEYHQSIALARYLAKKAKLVGKDDLEDLEIDSMVDTITDLRSKIQLYYWEQDAAIKESRRGPLMNEIIPFYLERMDKIAKENNGFLALKRLTWADMVLVALLDYLNSLIGSDLIAKHANLLRVKNNVLSLPAIKEWIAVRPVTER